MRNALITILAIIAILIGCNTTNNQQLADTETAFLRNYTGLDGCGWVIELENGEILEPSNLEDFHITPVEGMQVEIAYSVLNDVGSICMAGQIVAIDLIVAK